MVDEYKFPHAIFPINSTEMTNEGLKYGYQKIQGFLGLKNKQDYGITCIVTPNFIFVAVLSQPYHIEEGVESEAAKAEGGSTIDVPFYLDGYAYAGIYSLQDIGQKFPATAGIGFE